LIPGVITYVLYYILIPASVVLLMIGGIMIMVSAGNPELAGLGKKILFATIIGMFLSFGAVLIVKFVLTTIGAKPEVIQPLQ
jgi:hypothetical protein